MADENNAPFEPQPETDAPLTSEQSEPAAAELEATVEAVEIVEVEGGVEPVANQEDATDAAPEAPEGPEPAAEAPEGPESAAEAPEAAETPNLESLEGPDVETSGSMVTEADAEPVESSAPEPLEGPDVETSDSAAAEPQAEPPAGPEDEPAPAEAAEPEPVTAVTLGLLPEVFVSAVSTQLHFYAPEIVALPPRPGRQEQQAPAEDAPAGSSRRRGRRRGGEARDEASDAPAGQATEQSRPAHPRQRAVELITEPQRIKGSTRLEAKKQRRRDGREAGRRRAVVTEAEFLARREAVDREMIVRSKNGRIQIAVLEDNVLVEHYVARNQDASLIGNVYLGRVQNVLPSMEAAFVDIGRGRNAVLYSGEVDWDAVETGNQPRRIELALKTGDKVLVQVTKDPVGHKGARLTSQISLPGRYLVYVPGGAMNGISRKLPDTERARLKRILKEVLPESSGVIVRTAAEGATEDQLTRDVQRLTNQWEHISTQVESIQAPALLHSEPDLLVKIVRDVFNEDFSKMLIQGDDAHHTISNYLASVAPDLLERVERYEGDADPFDAFRVTEQIEKALDRKVWLPSGGSLVIDRTEAMTVVDVNTGKFVGSGGNLEETVTKNNLEAAEEIVRQLRLRDIGGIIVVDFIDMVLESNRDLVLRRLVECLSRDRTKHQVAEVTSLGLVQMTRKKLGLGLLETFSESCEVCAGRGIIVHHDPVVKHRAAAPSPQSSRRGPRQGAPSGGPSNGTHVITEGVKSALAQIAASTIHHHDDAPVHVDLPVEQPAPAAAEATPERPKKPRKKRGEAAKPKTEKDMLLDSVLNALPEPKAPGQGRSRRRVTTAALTGTPVSHLPTQE
ncbi:Rne/Rng family ribonuclease [Microbacterium sp. NPDC019599]|uniref:Rne/Rng family ribonuclease n=1 Tax=Microbacterium sp. NPDC019599 TaxID=3154690 RepID=UPI0033C15D1A